MGSRIAKQPIELPSGVEFKQTDGQVTVKGPKGSLNLAMAKKVTVAQNDGQLNISTVDDSTEANALSGTMRALLHNMVKGVHEGFEKKLTLHGVGYRAQVKGTILHLTLGFSHPVEHQIPEGITIEMPNQTEIVVKGIDKQQVGQVSADIRNYRPPEPYKGKGVRYADEVIILKETKKK